MSDLLNQFYNDEHTREAVREFFLKQLDVHALVRVYNKEDTKAIAEAREVIDKAFSELRDLYSPQKNNIKNNPAR